MDRIIESEWAVVKPGFHRTLQLGKRVTPRTGAPIHATAPNITPAGPFSAKVRPPRDQVLRRTVGPALDGLGNQRSREQLLDSMLFPNRAIAPGFENVLLTLKSGAQHGGVVKSEDDLELRLESPEEGPLRIAKADLVSRQRGLSAMPEGLSELLTKRELRDLVEFLAGLR